MIFRFSNPPFCNTRFWWLTSGLLTFLSLFILVPKIFPSIQSSIFFAAGLLILVIGLPIFIALAVYAIAATAVSRLKQRPLGKKTVLVNQLAASGILALVLVILLAKITPDPLPTGSYSDHFNRSTWLAQDEAAPTVDGTTARQRMLADLLPRLPGKSRKEIEAILGPSLETGYFQSNGRDLIYYLGPQRDSLFAIDSEWLLIWLDNQGKFKRFAIATD